MIGVVLLALLLLGATSCGDEARPTTSITLADSADQVLFGLQHYVTKQGVIQAQLVADTAYLFDAQQLVELRGVRTTFYGARGVQHSVLTSREGTYYSRTGDMEARGTVVVVATDGRRLESSVLRYTQATGKISTDRPFRFEEPGRRMEGESFISDPDFQNLEARGVRGQAGRVTIPNQ